MRKTTEINNNMKTPEEKILTLESLPSWREQLRSCGQKLVVTNGVFDLLHRGHAQYLREAAAFGDALLVCVNDDAGVRQLKGDGRPLVAAADRAYLLASLEAVAAVVIFPGTKATQALELAQPDVYVKGGDYSERTLDRKEYAVLKKARAQIRFIPFVGSFSTTNLARQIQKSGSEKASTPSSGSGLNPALNFIFARRSIRKFQSRPVSDEMITDLTKAAMAAPSACAKNPWEVLIVTDHDLKRELASYLPNGGFLQQAPVAIVLCGDIDIVHGGELSYLLQDCSAACQNMLLAATALGLGACWLGIHPREERIKAVRSLLQLPKNVIPVAGIALGWPAESKPPRTNFQAKGISTGNS
jgi:rfaE bifunctional protein nucleotidyltransferase chain/domain